MSNKVIICLFLFQLFWIQVSNTKNCGYKKYYDEGTNGCLSCHTECQQCIGRENYQCLHCTHPLKKCNTSGGTYCKMENDCSPQIVIEAGAITWIIGLFVTFVVILIVILAFAIFLWKIYKKPRPNQRAPKQPIFQGEVIEMKPQQLPNDNTNETEQIVSETHSQVDEIEPLTVSEAPLESFDVQRLNWDKRIQINSGAFGNVYKCPYKDNDALYYVAVKEAIRGSDEAFNEMEMMWRLKGHPNIIPLITTRLGDSMLLVMPLRKCNLLDFLAVTHEKTITQKIRYCQQIANGMSFLIFRRIVHCDLKARNILVVDENSVQISDFGKSQRMDYRKRTIGTITHTALELLDPVSRAVNNEATDIWAFGVTIWEIFNRIVHIPYSDVLKPISVVKLCCYLNDGNHLMTTNWLSTSDCPALSTISTYMFKCWTRKQENRPTFQSLGVMFFGLLPEGLFLSERMHRRGSTSSINSWESRMF